MDEHYPQTPSPWANPDRSRGEEPPPADPAAGASGFQPSEWPGYPPTSEPTSAGSLAAGYPPVPGPPSVPGPTAPPAYGTNPYASVPPPGNAYGANPYAVDPYGANSYGANPYGANPYGMGPYGPVPTQNQKALLAMIFGLVAIVLVSVIVGGFLGIAGIILGRQAQNQIDAEPGRFSGRGMATAGLWLGILGVVGSVIYVVGLIALVAFAPGSDF